MLRPTGYLCPDKLIVSTVDLQSAPCYQSRMMITETVRRAQTGDHDAFERLYAKHSPLIRNLCLRLTRDQATADDLTQEAFLQVHRKLGLFRGDAGFATWVYRIAYNLALLKFRKRCSAVVALEDLQSEEDDWREPTCLSCHDGQLEGTVDRIALTRAIEILPAKARMVFELKELDGFEHHEIARIMNCSIGTSKSQLFRAKERIRRNLSRRRHLPS